MVVSHFFSPLRTLKKKTRGRSGTDSKRTASSSSSSGHDAIDSGSWSDGIDGDDSVAPIGGVSVQSKKNMATGLCLCCGSKVTFPDTVACFKCTVCDTINDLRPLVRMEKVVDDGHVVSKARTPPPPLTLERLKAGVQAYRRHPEKQSLLEAMIRESFANWDVLNLSFPNGKEVSSDEPGIQLDEVRAAYKIILSLPTPFIRAMMNGIEQIMRRPGRPLDQKSDIRYLLIIIENPLLLQQSFPQEASYHHHIVKSIVGSLANLPNRVHYALVLWISQQSRSSLKRKVLLVNQFISYRVQKYDRAKRRNQAQTQRGANPLTSYSSRSNQTELPAFQRTRSVTNAPPPVPPANHQLITEDRITRHSRMRSNTDSRISLSSHERSSINDPGGPLQQTRPTNPFYARAERDENWRQQQQPLPLPPQQSNVNERNNSGASSAAAQPDCRTGLGIANLKLEDTSNRVSSLGAQQSSQSLSSQQLRSDLLRQQNRYRSKQSNHLPSSRVVTAPGHLHVQMPRPARINDDRANDHIVHSAEETQDITPSYSLHTQRLKDTSLSPDVQSVTSPPAAHARDSPTSHKDTDTLLQQVHFASPQLRSGDQLDTSSTSSHGATKPSNSAAPQKAHIDSHESGNMTSFVPIVSPNLDEDNGQFTQQNPAVLQSHPTQKQTSNQASRPKDRPGSSRERSNLQVDAFRSVREGSRGRVASVLISELSGPNGESERSRTLGVDMGSTPVDAVRPTRDSVLGVLDGTAEPSSPVSSITGHSSLTRTRSTSEAPARRRTDHDVLTALEPASSQMVGDWGIGVDLDDYYVGADGVFYPKTSSLVMYQHDWRLVAAAKVMALLHAANLLLSGRVRLPTDAFYNEAIESMDLVADYDSWQARTPGAFSFCQYPFLLSLNTKVQIMQVDAARQMNSKLKEAVISALFQNYHSRFGSNLTNQPHLKLFIRRHCLVEDSLHQLATHEQDLKKRLKIEFVGEEGIDAGGLTKEWFMLLVRELMNPMYGMFTQESDANAAVGDDGGENGSSMAWGGAYWFNPASLEASNQYFLVGVVVGLALYNSTILDLQLPLAVFKKLLRTSFYQTHTLTAASGMSSGAVVSPVLTAAKPADAVPQSLVSGSQMHHNGNKSSASSGSSSNGTSENNGSAKNATTHGTHKPSHMRYGTANAATGGSVTEGRSPVYGLLSPSAQLRYQINEMLADVAQFRPQLARGLRQLLLYREDDVEDVFYLTFEASYDAYGEIVTVPLVFNGANIPVTSHNRVEYVMRYLQWVLNDSVSRQFEPFRRGFYYVCGGNALSLFKPEEIELMVHGSGADWDPKDLQTITEYVNFGQGKDGQNNGGQKLISWFWEVLREISAEERRLFLSFVTGSDRIPTVASSKLRLKLVLLGNDYSRFPIAHTCFNQIGIWMYRSKNELMTKLLLAIKESEGFGLQ